MAVAEQSFIETNFRLGPKVYLNIVENVLLPWNGQHFDRNEKVHIPDFKP